MTKIAGKKFLCSILICSDRAAGGERPDETAQILKGNLEKSGYEINSIMVVPDNKDKIQVALKKWIGDGVPLILTSGGTGLSPRDVTPEATMELIERRIPGMEEAMRYASLQVTPHAMLSRAVVGAAGKSLIVNLPGNPKGALENFKTIEPALEHALRLINGEKVDK